MRQRCTNATGPRAGRSASARTRGTGAQAPDEPVRANVDWPAYEAENALLPDSNCEVSFARARPKVHAHAGRPGGRWNRARVEGNGSFHDSDPADEAGRIGGNKTRQFRHGQRAVARQIG